MDHSSPPGKCGRCYLRNTWPANDQLIIVLPKQVYRWFWRVNDASQIYHRMLVNEEDFPTTSNYLGIRLYNAEEECLLKNWRGVDLTLVLALVFEPDIIDDQLPVLELGV